MQIYTAIAIDTKVTGISDTTIGLTTDGFIRLITERPGYDGDPTYPQWEDLTNNTDEWFEGILLNKSIATKPQRNINILQTGSYGTVSDFSFNMDNSSKVWDKLFTYDIWLLNKEVEVYIVIDDVFYNAWAGVIKNDPYNEEKFNVQATSNYRTIHKNLPQSSITETMFPLAKQETIGDPIPVIVGDMNYAKMYNINSEETREIIGFYLSFGFQDPNLNYDVYSTPAVYYYFDEY